MIEPSPTRIPCLEAALKAAEKAGVLKGEP